MSDIKITGFPSNLFARQVTIPAGAAESDIVATQGMALVGIIVPLGWTAAAIGYRTNISGYVPHLMTAYDGSGNYEQSKVSTDAATNNVFIAIPQTDTLFMPWIQLTSRTLGTDTPVNQAAARTLTLLFRNYLS